VRLGRGRLPRAVRLPGVRGPNAVPGLRGPNAVPGLRGPNAVPGLRGPNAVRGRWRDVAGVDEVWRIDDEWWRPRPVSRRYVRCSLDDGTCLTLYEDLLDGTWWRQRA